MSEDIFRISEFEITFEPIKSRETDRLPTKVRERMQILSDAIKRNPEKVIPELVELINKYPHVSLFYNYLSSAYTNSGDHENAKKIIIENYEKFPNYLFAKVAFTEKCLIEGDTKSIPKIFRHKFDLTLLYPDRKLFHITEVLGFYGVIGKYLCLINDKLSAEKIYDFLYKLAPSHPLTIRLKKFLNQSLFKKLLFKLNHLKKH